MPLLLSIALGGGLPDPTRGSVLALGNFDGFHIGHRALADKALTLAKKLDLPFGIFTFDRSPAAFFGASAPTLSEGDEKLSLFAESSADFAVIADFSRLASMSARDFIERILIGKLGARGVVCGENFRFGASALGTPELLYEYFGENMISLPLLTFGGESVCSTRIRRLIALGDAETASKLLGRPYSFTLEVVHGRHDGTRLGFPTVNQLPPTGRAIPARGVYFSRLTVDGARLPSVTNVGFSPTLDKQKILRFETHIINYEGDLYGRTLKLEFLKNRRPEVVFHSAEELAEMVFADREAARRFFGIGAPSRIKHR